MKEKFLKFASEYKNVTRSQINQDVFALFVNGTSPGYFVEFGACDGLDCSNTFLLEAFYDWKGILAEPAKYWHESLKINRRCNIDYNCVADISGKRMEFWEVRGAKGVSSLAEYGHIDSHGQNRIADHESYLVDTISLDDLLDKYSAPQNINYLSIDTEGSELFILNNYSFSRKFNCITVEHNYSINKQDIENLLELKQYVKVLEDISEFDSWFIHKDLYERISIDS